MTATDHPDALDPYPVRLHLPVVWGDMDANLHLNNTVYLRHFENVRVSYFEAIGLEEAKKELGIGGILRDTYCRFKAPVDYPDSLWIGGRVDEVGEDRFTMGYLIWSVERKCVAAEGNGTIVCYDYRRQAKTAFPPSILNRIRELEESS